LAEYPTGTVTFVFTDVVESSRLWEDHSDAMQTAMAAHDAIVKKTVSANAGVLVKQTGDGAFAVFASAFDAVAAALAMREELATQSWGPITGLQLRVGVHTGEAELRDGDYFGPPVNRAARVMTTAEAGEVLLSLTTQEVVRDRLPAGLAIHDLGRRELRGMERPEQVFGLQTADEETAAESAAVSATTSWDEAEQARRAAWIAVLPFDNIGGDPEQQYFADGIAEDVITELSAFRSLRVIARTSSFRHRGADMGVREIAADLGVRFVLEGSVRRSGNRIRVVAQLIEAADGHHVWADRYDGELEDIFDVQDQITRSIVIAIDPAIRDAGAERALRTRPESRDAWDHVQRGSFEFVKYKKDANLQARREYDAAIALDAAYAAAWTGLSGVHFIDAFLNWSDDRSASLDLAYEAARKAVDLDSRDAAAHGALATVNWGLGRLDTAQKSAALAVELNPSLPIGHLIGGLALKYTGAPEDGIRMISTAMALAPRDPFANWYHGARALGYYIMGRFEEAVVDAREAVQFRHGYLMGRIVLAAALAQLDRLGEARNELDTMLELHPDFTPALLDPYPFSNPADRENLIAGLRRAGFTG
jgi:adenylate cyclase